jgi:hypothetical protein
MPIGIWSRKFDVLAPTDENESYFGSRTPVGPLGLLIAVLRDASFVFVDQIAIELLSINRCAKVPT